MGYLDSLNITGSALTAERFRTDIIDVYKRQAQSNVTTGFTYLPAVGPDISWTPADLAIDYTPAQVEFHPQTETKPAVYIPGELNVNVEQYPKVEIEYVGEPMYVPPSANPSYEE